MQQALARLHGSIMNWELTVNMSETGSVEFRRGRRTAVTDAGSPVFCI